MSGELLKSYTLEPHCLYCSESTVSSIYRCVLRNEHQHTWVTETAMWTFGLCGNSSNISRLTPQDLAAGFFFLNHDSSRLPPPCPTKSIGRAASTPLHPPPHRAYAPEAVLQAASLPELVRHCCGAAAHPYLWRSPQLCDRLWAGLAPKPLALGVQHLCRPGRGWGGCRRGWSPRGAAAE